MAAVLFMQFPPFGNLEPVVLRTSLPAEHWSEEEQRKEKKKRRISYSSCWTRRHRCMITYTQKDPRLEKKSSNQLCFFFESERRTAPPLPLSSVFPWGSTARSRERVEFQKKRGFIADTNRILFAERHV